jgi:hypothetical protein
MKSVIATVLSVALVMMVGCSEKAAAPVGPTPLADTPVSAPSAPETPAAASGGAVIAGTINIPGGASGFGAQTITTGVVVSVVGTDVTALVGVTGAFELRGVPAGDVTLRIMGGGIDTVVAVGAVQTGQAVQLVIVVSGQVPVISADSRLGHGQPIEIEGTIAEKRAPDRIVVRSQLVAVTGSTDIRFGDRALTYADLAVGLRVHVRGAAAVEASATVVVAESITVQGDSTTGPPAEVTFRGTVASVAGGSCDAKNLSFTVSLAGGGTKSALTAPNTKFSPSCTVIKAGVYVEATGTVDAGSGVLLAGMVYADASEKPGSSATPITFNGTVGALTGGSCGAANLTFDAAVSGVSTITRHVRTSGATAISPSCASVAAGVKVTVEGVLFDGNVVEASKVTVEPASSAPVTTSGTVAALISGSCSGKDLRFYISVTGITGVTRFVQTSAATAFSPSCTDVSVGAKVTVEGPAPSGDTVAAARVTVVQPAGTPITFTGTVGALTGGSCSGQAIAFDAVVSGVTTITKHVTASSTTAFSPSCAAVVVGAKVTVEGQLLDGNFVMASKVTVTDSSSKVTVIGTISGFVATSCPALAFTVTVTGVTPATMPVQTSSSTAFTPGCTPLKDGDKVKVEGTKPGDKLLATSVTKY